MGSEREVAHVRPRAIAEHHVGASAGSATPTRTTSRAQTSGRHGGGGGAAKLNGPPALAGSRPAAAASMTTASTTRTRRPRTTASARRLRPRCSPADDARLGQLRGARRPPTRSLVTAFEHAIDALSEAGVPLKRLFGLEHGLRGEAQDMIAVDAGVDPLSGIETVSLYGHTFESLTPPAGSLMTWTSCSSTFRTVAATTPTSMAWLAARACSGPACGRVLDRPNPPETYRGADGRRRVRLLRRAAAAPTPRPPSRSSASLRSPRRSTSRSYRRPSTSARPGLTSMTRPG